jgi:hypothetical protein
MNTTSLPLDRQVLSAIDDAVLGDFIAIRNDLAHAGELSSADCELQLRNFVPALDRCLRILVQRLTGRLVHVSSLRFLDGQFEVLGREISGVDAAFKPYNSKRSEPLECNHTYWKVGDRYYDLEPLLVARMVNDGWRVYVYDGYKGPKPTGPDGSEELKYIEILTRKRQESVGEYRTSHLGLP